MCDNQHGLFLVSQSQDYVQDFPDHEVIQAAGDIRPEMRLGQAADRMDRPDGFPVLHFLFVTVQACRQDPHQAAVPIVPFIPPAAQQRVSAFSVSADGRSRAHADII